MLISIHWIHCILLSIQLHRSWLPWKFLFFFQKCPEENSSKGTSSTNPFQSLVWLAFQVQLIFAHFYRILRTPLNTGCSLQSVILSTWRTRWREALSLCYSHYFLVPNCMTYKLAESYQHICCKNRTMHWDSHTPQETSCAMKTLYFFQQFSVFCPPFALQNSCFCFSLDILRQPQTAKLTAASYCITLQTSPQSMHPQSTFRSNGIIFLSKVPPFAEGLLNTSHASLLFEKFFSSVTLSSCELQRESRWCLPRSTPGQPYPFCRCCSNEHLDKLISRGHHYGHACAHAWWYWDFSSYLEMNLSELTSLMSNCGCPCTFTLKMEMLHSCSHCQGFLVQPFIFEEHTLQW